ncbi:MAG: TonB-dependent receptor [Candidatus Krumholzibacteria bacterium]|nr:TonB-dependent receptor [Candidatus Krumholzibacteria bacterium]
MTRLRRAVAAAGSAAALVAGAAAASAATGADTTVADTTVVIPAPLRLRAFGVVEKDAYLRRHSVTLDHYLEHAVGHVLERQGPIGRDVAFSRWGMGRGRALALLDGVEINDPQDGVAPLVHFPVSALAVMRLDGVAEDALVEPAAIEGVLSVERGAPPTGKPTTFIELSKGTHDLRQRRVRISSVAGVAGADLSYDEVLNDGYLFDASGALGAGTPGYGSAQARYLTASLRGELPGGERYAFGLNRFTSDASGDLAGADNETRRSGHLATLRAELDESSLVLFNRGHAVTHPDSETANLTTGAYASWRRGGLVLRAGFEDIAAEQRFGPVVTNSGLRKLAASAALGGDVVGGAARAWFSSTAYWRGSVGWGAGAEVVRPLGAHEARVRVARGFRVPTLAELYMPPHPDAAGVTLAGNADVGAEHAWSAEVRGVLRLGPLVNEIAVSAVRAGRTIDFRPADVNGQTWRVAGNGSDHATLAVLEDRLRVEARAGATAFSLGGGVALGGGEREGFFASTPALRATGAARVGWELFGGSSALYMGAEYHHTGERRDYAGAPLAAYDVVNLTLDGRLVDAHLYLALLNALDTRYSTAAGYLMTPRTFMYGLAWTLFE